MNYEQGSENNLAIISGLLWVRRIWRGNEMTTMTNKVRLKGYMVIHVDWDTSGLNRKVYNYWKERSEKNTVLLEIVELNCILSDAPLYSPAWKDMA